MDGPLIQNPQLEGDSFFWPGGVVGVLLLHGYTATTAEVRPLAMALHAKGYTVDGPLLPGHGTTPEDLNNCRWTDWTGAVEAAYRQLAARCEHVMVGGESMGAMLALYLASEHPELAAIMLYAPALKVSWQQVVMARLVSRVVPIRPKPKPLVRTIVDTRWKGYTVNAVRAAVQLFDLQKVVLARLDRVSQPIMVVQGRLDQTIDPRSGEWVLSRVRSREKELHWLERSTHCVILDAEMDTAVELTLEFMTKALQARATRVGVSGTTAE